MIVLNLTMDGIYGFHDFSVNFTYPKKIATRLLMMNIWKEGGVSATKKLCS